MTDYNGKIIASVEGLKKNSDADVKIHFTDGSFFWMKHFQDCCENVYLVDIDGEINAGDVWQGFDERSERQVSVEDYDSSTWTFYTLHTSSGYVWLRFIGESNGYYSEGVDSGYCAVGEKQRNW